METPLNATSTTAGGLLSGGRFTVPQFQREYAWDKDEVSEFFSDLSQSLGDETYFLGLVIVTGDGSNKDIVDGQQRLLTLTLLVAALYHETRRYERKALADRLQSTFLRSIDFESDDEVPDIIDHDVGDLGAWLKLWTWMGLLFGGKVPAAPGGTHEREERSVRI